MLYWGAVMQISTRPSDRFDSTTQATNIPLIELIPLAHRPFKDPLKRKIVFLFSSPGAIQHVKHWAKDLIEGGAPVLSLSQGVTDSLKLEGITPSWQSQTPSIKGVVKGLRIDAESILGEPLKNFIVVHPGALGTNLKQSLFLMGTGLEIRNLPVYQSIMPSKAIEQYNAVKDTKNFEWFFFSGSAVKNFKKLCQDPSHIEKNQWKIFCIGQTSLDQFKNWGIHPQSISYAESQEMMEKKS